MPFGVGNAVVVLPLGRKRGIVTEVGRGGHYRVQVAHTTVACRERDLEAVSEQRHSRTGRSADPPAAPADDGTAVTVPRLDLHGLTVEEALVRVVEAIDAALRGGADRLEVIHGKGSGRIRAALHRHLETMTVVASFRVDPRNPGVTWVHF